MADGATAGASRDNRKAIPVTCTLHRGSGKRRRDMTGHEPHFVIIRLCSCGTVSLREGDDGGNAISLSPAEAGPLLDAISAAFVPGTAEPSPGTVGCLACLGSLVTAPRPAPFGEVTCTMPAVRGSRPRSATAALPRLNYSSRLPAAPDREPGCDSEDSADGDHRHDRFGEVGIDGEGGARGHKDSALLLFPVDEQHEADS